MQKLNAITEFKRIHKNHQVNFFFFQIILYHHFLQNMLLLAIQRTRLKCKTAWLWLIDSYAYGCYMVLYSLYKSRLRQIKIRACHTRCFHPFHILFTLFVLSSSATPASESSFYTYTSGPLLPFSSQLLMHESVGRTWHLKNFYCPNSLGTS